MVSQPESMNAGAVPCSELLVKKPLRARISRAQAPWWQTTATDFASYQPAGIVQLDDTLCRKIGCITGAFSMERGQVVRRLGMRARQQADAVWPMAPARIVGSKVQSGSKGANLITTLVAAHR